MFPREILLSVSVVFSLLFLQRTLNSLNSFYLIPHKIGRIFGISGSFIGKRLAGQEEVTGFLQVRAVTHFQGLLRESRVKEEKGHHPFEVNKMNKKELGAVEGVYEYLRSQNRPYSVNDIVLNLHKEHGKAAVQKALEKLVQDERVREKTYGKQKVFLINQAGIPEASPEELKKMDQEIEEKEKRIKELETSCKNVQNELKELSSTMTTEEAKALVDKLTKENLELDTKYKALSANNTVVLDKSERDQIRKKRANAIAEWRKRKRMCLEMLNPVLEDWPGTKESIYEEISIETDEDAGATIPTD